MMSRALGASAVLLLLLTACSDAPRTNAASGSARPAGSAAPRTTEAPSAAPSATVAVPAAPALPVVPIPRSWKRFDDPDGHFSISIPGTPHHRVLTVAELHEGEVAAGEVLVGSAPDIFMTFDWSEYASDAEAAKRAEHDMYGEAKKLPGDAVVFETVDEMTKEGPTTVVTRRYVVGRRVYRIALTKYEIPVDKAFVAAVFASFSAK